MAVGFWMVAVALSTQQFVMLILTRPKVPMSRCALHTPDLASCEIILPRLKIVFYSGNEFLLEHIKIN
jgi:hypothetical protein